MSQLPKMVTCATKLLLNNEEKIKIHKETVHEGRNNNFCELCGHL